MPPRPAVSVSRDKGDVYQDSIEALAAANVPPRLFRQGSALVRVGRDDNRSPVIIPLSDKALRADLAVMIRWVKDAREGGQAPALPDDVSVDGILTHADQLAGVPPIAQVVTAPVFARDGTLETAEGYSPATRNWYEPPPGMTVWPVAPRPTQREANAALAYLAVDYLGDFPFDGEPSRQRALALLLAPFIRLLITGPVPLHAADASTPGTGKSLLQRACLLPALGPRIPMMAGSVLAHEDELRKVITAQLLRGRPVLRWDNVNCALDSGALSALVTEPVWDERKLGGNTSADIAIRAVCVVNGNNLRYSQETARRLMPVRLDANAERPEKGRVFRHPDLIAWGEGNRGTLVHAVLTCVQAWLAAGRPPGGETLGSFESWAAVTGGILSYATGMRGALLDGLDRAYEESADERDALADFFTAWYEAHGTTPVDLAEIEKLLWSHDPFGISDLAGRSRSTQVGMRLHRIRGQVIGGYKLLKVRRKWHISPVQPR